MENSNFNSNNKIILPTKGLFGILLPNSCAEDFFINQYYDFNKDNSVIINSKSNYKNAIKLSDVGRLTKKKAFHEIVFSIFQDNIEKYQNFFISTAGFSYNTIELLLELFIKYQDKGIFILNHDYRDYPTIKVKAISDRLDIESFMIMLDDFTVQ